MQSGRLAHQMAVIDQANKALNALKQHQYIEKHQELVYEPKPIKGTVFYTYTHESVQAIAKRVKFDKWECDCHKQTNPNCALHGWGKYVLWCCGHLHDHSLTCTFDKTKHSALNHNDLIHKGILSEPRWYSDSELDLDGFPVLDSDIDE